MFHFSLFKFDMLDGEVWWGGTTAKNACPLDQNSVYHEDMRDFSTSSSNQAMPLFLSSRGRYLWSDAPFDIRVKSGRITVKSSGRAPELVKAGETLRDAYLAAQKVHFPCDQRTLPTAFFKNAQLNTWMEFTYYPTQQGVLDFARKWVESGFKPGIFTIDEGWQRRYGVWSFDPARFPDPKGMVDEMHRLGFKVLLWIVPYVSADGADYVRSVRPLEGTDPEMAKRLYLRTKKGNVALFSWWNGFSAMLDMTDEYNRRFLKEQLDRLMTEYGVDGFKFDGGSVNGYSPLHVENGKLAKSVTAHELNAAWNAFGAEYEYHEFKDTYGRGGFNTIQRLRDKNHRWTEKGINMLLPCALTAGLIGYPFLCPDMIGGGEWTFNYLPGFHIDEELFIRMAQCSALFPMMQFSWAPWKALGPKGLSLCLEAARLHERMASRIENLVRKAEQDGEPILRALEYVDPNAGFEHVADEFLLGNDLLVAPVVTEKTYEREVFFPAGCWKDENGNRYEGRTRRILSAPIEKLLWFERIETGE